MGGVLKIDKNNTWMVSKWFFNFTIEQILLRLKNKELASEIDYIPYKSFEYIELLNLTSSEKREILDIVEEVLEDLRSEKLEFGDKLFLPGVFKGLEQLVEMLRCSAEEIPENFQG